MSAVEDFNERRLFVERKEDLLYLAEAAIAELEKEVEELCVPLLDDEAMLEHLRAAEDKVKKLDARLLDTATLYERANRKAEFATGRVKELEAENERLRVTLREAWRALHEGHPDDAMSVLYDGLKP